MPDRNPPAEGATACFALTITGLEVDPDELTNRSGIMPSHVARVGRSLGKRPAARTNVWTITSPDFPVERTDEEWSGFVSGLTFVRDARAYLPPAARLTLSVCVSANGYYVHFQLSKDMAAFCLAHEIGMEIQITAA